MTQTAEIPNLIQYRFEAKRQMPIGASTLYTTISAPSYSEALESLLEAFPEIDPLTVTTTV